MEKFIIKNVHNRCFLLKNGGIVVITKIGPLQFGVPPNSLEEFEEMQLEFPKFFIIPSVLFEKKHMITIFNLEKIVHHNFTNNKKTIIICNKESEKNIKTIFQEEVLGPLEYKVFFIIEIS